MFPAVIFAPIHLVILVFPVHYLFMSSKLRWRRMRLVLCAPLSLASSHYSWKILPIRYCLPPMWGRADQVSKYANEAMELGHSELALIGCRFVADRGGWMVLLSFVVGRWIFEGFHPCGFAERWRLCFVHRWGLYYPLKIGFEYQMANLLPHVRNLC